MSGITFPLAVIHERQNNPRQPADADADSDVCHGHVHFAAVELDDARGSFRAHRDFQLEPPQSDSQPPVNVEGLRLRLGFVGHQMFPGQTCRSSATAAGGMASMSAAGPVFETTSPRLSYRSISTNRKA